MSQFEQLRAFGGGRIGLSAYEIYVEVQTAAGRPVLTKEQWVLREGDSYDDTAVRQRLVALEEKELPDGSAGQVVSFNTEGRPVAIPFPELTWTGLPGKPSVFPSSAHQHPISDVTGLQSALDVKAETAAILTSEQVQDLVAAMFQGGSHVNISVNYNDAAGTMSLTGVSGGASLTQEQVEDMVGALVQLGAGLSGGYDDAGNLLSISLSGISFTTTLKTKLDGIAAGATANATDAHLLSRANHTGTQAISTVTGLQSALDSLAARMAAVEGDTNTAPTSSPIPTQTLTLGSAWSFSVAPYFADADGDVLTYTVVAGSLPPGMTRSGANFAMTATALGTATPGDYSVTVRGTDPDGAWTERNIPLVIPDKPQLTATVSTLTAGQPFTITFNEVPDSVAAVHGQAVVPTARTGTTKTWIGTVPDNAALNMAVIATLSGYKTLSESYDVLPAPPLFVSVPGGFELRNVDTSTPPISIGVAQPASRAGTYTINPAQFADGPIWGYGPHVTGTVTHGSTLTVDPGLPVWLSEMEPVSVARKWLRGATVQAAVEIPDAEGVTYTVDATADGGKNIYCAETITDAQGRSRTAISAGIAVPVLADTMRVQTGSYTGTGARIDVPLAFAPDLVLVWADAVQPLVWKADLPWHGRSQRLDAGDSDYQLCRFGGERYEKFKGLGFGALPAYSVSGRTYRYAAIRYNGSPAAAHTSIIGNGQARDLIYADWTPDLTLIKRDSPQPAVLTMTGLDPEQTTTSAGALAGAVEHILGGVRLSGANQVNQNTPPALGEGIEHMAFRASQAVSVLEYTGDGASSRALGIGADFALIVPVGASSPSVAVTPTAARGVSGEAVSGFVGGANLTVPASHNAAGVKYRVLALRDTGAAIISDAVPVPTACGIVTGEEARLSNSFALSGACTLEFWGKPRSVSGSKWFMPLLMGGVGDQGGTPNTYNCGLYGYAADPDGHGWSGAAIRWMQHPRMAKERTSPYNSINRYNLNSGIVQAVDDAVHMVLTHDGAGLWRLFLNGKMAKEHRRSMALETAVTLPDGGDGVARPLYLFGAMLGGVFTGISGEIYRAQAWASCLTDAQAKALYAQIKGQAVSIPAARDTWDFRSGIPAGVTGVVAGVPGQSRVALTLTPVASIGEGVAVGAVVATFTSDATAFALSGDDAALLEVSGTEVRTKAAITGQTTLDFTVTASRPGYLPRPATASVTVFPVTGPAWYSPAFTPGTEADSTGSITANGDGSLTITATTYLGNPRVYFDVVAGGSYELDTRLEWGDATRVICRTSDTQGLTGTTVFDMTKASGETTLSRTGDVFTPAAGQVALHYVFVMARYKVAKILPATRVRKIQ